MLHRESDAEYFIEITRNHKQSTNAMHTTHRFLKHIEIKWGTLSVPTLKGHLCSDWTPLTGLKTESREFRKDVWPLPSRAQRSLAPYDKLVSLFTQNSSIEVYKEENVCPKEV